MKLETAMNITQSKPYAAWRDATAKALAECKAQGFDTGDLLRCLRTEIETQLRRFESDKPKGAA